MGCNALEGYSFKKWSGWALAEGGVGMRRVDPGREAAAQLRQVAGLLVEAAWMVEDGALLEGRATLEDIGEVAARGGETLDQIMEKSVE